MKKSLLIITLTAFVLSVNAQFPSNVKKIEVKPNGTVSVSGNLSSGKKIEDLSWASQSSVACWPATQNTKFRGNHVLYSTVIPKKSEMYIKVIPDDKNANFSIYAYQIGTTNYATVPDLSTCVACEAEHKWDYPKVGKTQDHTREVYLNAIANPYNVVIAVVGADGLTTGGFKLEIKLVGGAEELAQNQAEVKVTTVECKANSTVSFKGDLKNGVLINDLSWASTSSNACWPATQNKKFTGHHVLYKTALPKQAKMYIKVIPDDKNANFSIYAYQVGTTNNSVVPNLASCVTCEAEHKWDYPKAGRTQDHTREVYVNSIKNPYNIFIGVVGADGLKAGGYTLEVKVVGGEDVALEDQAPIKQNKITPVKDKTMSWKGNLSDGVKINDLSWAWQSSVACFPETQKAKFTGNHVIYQTELPKYSIMDITVVPDDPKQNFSVYAYTVGATNDAMVPNLPSCVSCEAEHKWDRPKVGKTQDHTRTITNLTAINNPYRVVIGVVGADGLTSGGYTLKVSLKSR